MSLWLNFLSRKVRDNIIDIIYNSQLNEFVIEKFKVLSKNGINPNQAKKVESDYHFDPMQLQELVTKRDSFEDFKHTLRFMNKSFRLLKAMKKRPKGRAEAKKNQNLKFRLARAATFKEEKNKKEGGDQGQQANSKKSPTNRRRRKSKSRSKSKKKRRKKVKVKEDKIFKEEDSSPTIDKLLKKQGSIKNIEDLEKELDQKLIQDFKTSKFYFPNFFHRKKFCYVEKKRKKFQKNKYEVNNQRGIRYIVCLKKKVQD